MSLIVPENPIALGSVRITPNSNYASYIDWTKDNQRESYELLQKTVQIWHNNGINDYMIFGKVSENTPFNWEIVPYQESGSTFWKQIKVLYNLTFGASSQSVEERQKIADGLIHPNTTLKDQSSNVSALSLKYDAFCNPEVIKNQLVFEGKHIYVIYPYAPIARLHFLLVTKAHHEKFSELTQEEYLEASELEQKLLRYYQADGYSTANLFNKTGAEAGQTVPHWHQHIIFTAAKTEDLYGRLLILKNMTIGPSLLSQTELKDRVSSLNSELSPYLKSN